jgi:hypothetical protein
MTGRRETGLLMLATCAALLLRPAMPGGAQDASWTQAADRLAREKVLAQGCASILKTFGDDAPMARVQGQRLYARARADMDGLVGQFIADLAVARSLAEAPALRLRLEAVVGQRRTLCRHVDAAVGTAFRQQRGGTHAADLLAEGSGDAAGSMLDAAVQVWTAYRHADQVGREAIMSCIEAMRWLPYGEVLAA